MFDKLVNNFRGFLIFSSRDTNVTSLVNIKLKNFICSNLINMKFVYPFCKKFDLCNKKIWLNILSAKLEHIKCLIKRRINGIYKNYFNHLLLISSSEADLLLNWQLLSMLAWLKTSPLKVWPLYFSIFCCL